MSGKREHWSSSFGFILAAVGSAVGLGNLWKFPYIAWDNSGGAFVLVYLGCILLIGMPIMMAEILMGRRSQRSAVPAFEKLGEESIGGAKWAFVGWIGVICGGVILSFYAVIAGWSISSFFQCLSWSISGYESPGPNAFGNFLSNAPLQILLSFLFSTATALIVMRGISGGIEKATRILMPALLAIMLLLVINSMFITGFGEAMSFLFKPDFGKLTGHSVLEALGHAFFTLSLGMGAMITYGSYIGQKESIIKASIAIVIMDTLIALMACIIMYTILFAFPETQENLGRSAVGMLFVTLPEMFYTKMTGGVILGPIFYILVAFAALSSTISLLEVVVALLVDKMKMTRRNATLSAGGTIFVFSVFCALSLGGVDFLTNFKLFGSSSEGFLHKLQHIFFAEKTGVLNGFDHFASNWLLPIGGLLTTLFVGWFLKKKVIVEELGFADENGKERPIAMLYMLLMKIVAPAAILYIIYKVFTGADFS